MCALIDIFSRYRGLSMGGSDSGIVDRDVRQISQWVSLGSYFYNVQL
jgi:hypothetical protein